jgi:hypothetical protein
MHAAAVVSFLATLLHQRHGLDKAGIEAMASLAARQGRALAQEYLEFSGSSGETRH